MTTKLTLSVEKRVIQRAKKYAQLHSKSLSEIVTSYLGHLATDSNFPLDIDPEVLSASDTIAEDTIANIDDVKLSYLKGKHIHG